MEHLLEEVREFIEKRDWEQFHTPKNVAMALSVEAAELVELYRRTARLGSSRLESWRTVSGMR